MPTTQNASARGARRRLAALVVLIASAALLSPSTAAAAYGWPLKPFDKQHPVRGFFGDPRIEDGPHRSESFHFGIDICAADGTPVYATISGRVVVETSDPNVVSVSAGGVSHSYWHVVPIVRPGQNVVARRTVIGRVQAPWGHVHLSERRNGAYVNPLRPSALAPYADLTRPVVEAISFERRGIAIGRVLRGRVDLVAQVGDRHPLRVPDRFRGKPVMPAVVRWRIIGGRSAGRWQTAVDLRYALPTGRFSDVYGVWTRQNKPWRRGRYRIVLARSWSTSQLAPGRYRLEVFAADTRGNAVVRTAGFSVRLSASAG